MYILPLAISPVPHAGLLGLAGAGPALAIDVLGEADVGDAGCVLPDDVHVRVQDGGVDRLAVLGQHCGQAGIPHSQHRVRTPPTLNPLHGGCHSPPPDRGVKGAP